MDIEIPDYAANVKLPSGTVFRLDVIGAAREIRRLSGALTPEQNANFEYLAAVREWLRPFAPEAELTDSVVEAIIDAVTLRYNEIKKKAADSLNSLSSTAPPPSPSPPPSNEV
jgi:hypothetical protein